MPRSNASSTPNTDKAKKDQATGRKGGWFCGSCGCCVEGEGESEGEGKGEREGKIEKDRRKIRKRFEEEITITENDEDMCSYLL
eukprot:1217864-Amorphochlora_amoeboformis.AAC.1